MKKMITYLLFFLIFYAASAFSVVSPKMLWYEV